MNESLRISLFYLVAIGLHGAVLWGISFGPPAFVTAEDTGLDATEVALVESAAEDVASEEAAPPESSDTPEPTPPEPVAEPTQPSPPPEAIPEPTPEPAPKPVKKEPPKPLPPKSVARAAAKPAVKKAVANAAAPTQGSPLGTPGGIRGKPGRGDQSHATWRHKAFPVYPEAARVARLTGTAQIEVAVNALGRPTSVRVVRSSGSPSLDEAALRAVRASTFNPKKIAGIPLPDTVQVPVSFRLDRR
jgi:protein TonB